MYEEFVIVSYGRRGDVPEGGDELMADGGVVGWIRLSQGHRVMDCGVIVWTTSAD